jgi:hypothetical protein
MKETALIRAAHNGHLAVVEHLLGGGANVAARDLVRGFRGRGRVEEGRGDKGGAFSRPCKWWSGAALA